MAVGASLELSLEFVLLCVAMQGHYVTLSQLTSMEQHFNGCTGEVMVMASSGSSVGGGPGLYFPDKPGGQLHDFCGSAWDSLAYTS